MAYVRYFKIKTPAERTSFNADIVVKAVAETPQSDKVAHHRGRENLGELTATHVPRTKRVPRRSKIIRTFCPEASAADRELSCTIQPSYRGRSISCLKVDVSSSILSNRIKQVERMDSLIRTRKWQLQDKVRFDRQGVIQHIVLGTINLSLHYLKQQAHV